MSETDRIQAAAQSSSDAPETLDSDGVVPSPSTRQTALLIGAVVVGVLVLLWLRQRRSENQDGTPDGGGSVHSQLTDDTSGDESEDSEVVTGEIEVPRDPTDPLAADEAVMEAFRERGTITAAEEG